MERQNTKVLRIVKDVSLETFKDSRGLVLTFRDLVRRVKSGRILFMPFRYATVTLITPYLPALTLPAITGLILWFLSRGCCIFEDVRGNLRRVTLVVLAKFILRYLIDLFQKKSLLRIVSNDIRSISSSRSASKPKYIVDMNKPPLYLRTDFWFGLQSGGSIGHIAGVLNNLGHFTTSPLFLTTDFIATVRDSIETRMFDLGDRFWDFHELPQLYFNRIFSKQAEVFLSGRDISFVYHRMSSYHYCGAMFARAHNVPYILEYNGPETWIRRQWGSTTPYDALCEAVEDVTLRAADLIVVVSSVMHDELAARGIEISKICINPNGVDPELYYPDIDGRPIRERYRLTGKTVIGFIGTFGRWHGAEVMAEAFYRVLQQMSLDRDSVRLFFVGDGLMLPEVKKLVQRHSLDDVVIFAGSTPQAEGPNYLAACDILVSPQIPNADGTPFFGSPTKVFEYMAMGKGIVASNLGQIGEVLSHGKTAWLTEPGDPTSLAEGLSRLVTDEKLRCRLGLAARHEVVSSYTWRMHTERIIKAIEERFS